MITPRSALKFDLFAEASRQHKRDEVGDAFFKPSPIKARVRLRAAKA
jgi:hypothetical protein